MKWGEMRPAMKALVETMLGFSAGDGHVEWKGTPAAAFARPGLRIDMSARSVTSAGRDEQRRIPAAHDTDAVCISGARQFVWTLRVESDDQSDDTIAQVYADRIRARLQREASTLALNAVDLAVATLHPSQPIDFKSQDRVLSVVAIDVTMNAVENDIDDVTGSADWIETVQYASENIVGVDGNPISPQISGEVSR